MWAKYSACITSVETREAEGVKFAAFSIEFQHVGTGLTWSVVKRFSDFVTLHQTLKQEYQVTLPPLPPRQLFRNVTPRFLHERRQLLQAFLERLLSSHCISQQWEVLTFIQVPDLTELGAARGRMDSAVVQWVSGQHGAKDKGMIFNCKSPYMGTRVTCARAMCSDSSLRRLICRASEPSSKTKINWAAEGQTVCKMLRTIHQHEFLVSLQQCDVMTEPRALVVVEKFYSRGSLRDLIHGKDPTEAYLTKYGNDGSPMELESIRLFGRQILEGLLFIQSRPFPYGHLHTGNVLLSITNTIKLCGLENTLLGQDPYLISRYPRADLSSLSLRILDVISFGHVLFEMAFGFEPDRPHPKYIPPHSSNRLREIIQSILQGSRKDYPTVRELCSMPFFSSVAIHENLYEPESVKLTTSMRSILRRVKGVHPPDQPSRADMLARSSCSNSDDESSEEPSQTPSKVPPNHPLSKPRFKNGNLSSGLQPPNVKVKGSMDMLNSHDEEARFDPFGTNDRKSPQSRRPSALVSDMILKYPLEVPSQWGRNSVSQPSTPNARRRKGSKGFLLS
eukprot:comp19527_c0_seq1/m.22847 comp19527_c0_seq1/g.22847  ORF comp19527_c0_seq1/g.22847 comp19527_c0_seq1/m.22847 type:complete len:563 (-) comp19527_c0_seq1:285-1973(-)